MQVEDLVCLDRRRLACRAAKKATRAIMFQAASPASSADAVSNLGFLCAGSESCACGFPDLHDKVTTDTETKRLHREKNFKLRRYLSAGKLTVL
jgi:hypothetical protein